MVKHVIVSLGLLVALVACSQQPSAEDLYSQAVTLTEQGDLQEASQKFELILHTEDVPDSLNAKVLFALAENAGNQEYYQDAINYYRRIVNNYGSTDIGPKAQFMIGYTYANILHDYNRAEQAYQKFLDIYPTNDLVSDAEFELKYLGRDDFDITDLDFLNISD